MAVDQGNVSKILSVLSHPLRREILLDLSNKGESSFTDLLNLLKVDTGKLSFHLRTLAPFIEQTPAGKYKLSRAGESAVRVIHDVEGWAEVADVERRKSHLPLASFKKRLFAYSIDFSLILAITLVISLLPEVLTAYTLLEFENNIKCEVEARNNNRLKMPRWYIIGTKGTLLVKNKPK